VVGSSGHVFDTMALEISQLLAKVCTGKVATQAINVVLVATASECQWKLERVRVELFSAHSYPLPYSTKAQWNISGLQAGIQQNQGII